MASLLSARDREQILTRLRQLTPDQRPRWGTLTARQTSCHMADQLRVALGDLPCERRDSFITRSLAKWAAIYLPLPTPRGRIKTAPEMLTSQPGDWAADLETCAGLVERVAGERCDAVHPTFGPLTNRQWARLAHRHMDHHLRQFGH